jgi:hypothetical protein
MNSIVGHPSFGLIPKTPRGKPILIHDHEFFCADLLCGRREIFREDRPKRDMLGNDTADESGDDGQHEGCSSVLSARGAAFLAAVGLAAFLAEAFSGATCAPCAATAAALSVGVVSAVVIVLVSFSWFAHDDSSLWSREKASG